MPAVLYSAPKPEEAPPPPKPATGPAPAALRAFVGQRLETLPQTKRKRRLDRWRDYLRGEQFESRELDEHGCYRQSLGFVASFATGPDGIAPWRHRHVPASINVAGDIVDQLTDWAVVGPSFCELAVTGDDDATAWLDGLCQESNLRHATEAAVFTAGGCGSAAVSVAWVEDAIDKSLGGAVRFEVHEPGDCWPLSWADRKNLVPHEVVKVFRPHDEYALESEGPPADGHGDYVLRYWSGRLPDGTPGVEAYYLARRSKVDDSWDVTALSPPYAHGSPRCPVFWVPRGDVPEQEGFDGRPFFDGAEGLIDAANELCQAGDNTAKRNAEDTLVVKEDPDKAPARAVKKGALGTIYAKGGAEYLSQKGDSSKLLYELSNQRSQQAYRQSHVIKVDVETLSRQTTGEALKRLYSAQINEADNVRLWVTKWFLLPACSWLLASSRAMRAFGYKVRMPRLKVVDKETGEITYAERKPGASSAVEVTWPMAFPPTPDDAKAASETVRNSVGVGAMSRETAVSVLIAAGVPAGSPEAELKRLKEDASESAENQAKAIGMAEGEKVTAQAKAGDVTIGGEKDNEGDE